MTESLPVDVVRALSGPGVAERLGAWAGRVSYRTEIGSTNEVALEMASAGAPNGTVVLAGRQTAGRGRRGHSWFSPVDAGLYCSVVLHHVRSPTVTLLAGVAVVEGIRRTTMLPVELEWPNDIVFTLRSQANRSSRRVKLGGILSEAVPCAAGLSTVVVGVGVNLLSVDYPDDIGGRASSLEAHLGYRVDRGLLLVGLLAALASWQTRCLSEGDTSMLARWRDLSPSSSGSAVAWVTPDGRRSGVTAGVWPDGSLRVWSGGRVERIVGGTLEWLGDVWQEYAVR